MKKFLVLFLMFFVLFGCENKGEKSSLTQYKIGESYYINDSTEEYILLKQENNEAVFIQKEISTVMAFGNSSDYESSEIDEYLNNEYYESLPFKEAILETQINIENDIIARKIFAPSLYEIESGIAKNYIVAIASNDYKNNKGLTQDEFGNSASYWLQTSNNSKVYRVVYDSYFLDDFHANDCGVRAMFKIDLNKVNSKRG